MQEKKLPPLPSIQRNQSFPVLKSNTPKNIPINQSTSNGSLQLKISGGVSSLQSLESSESTYSQQITRNFAVDYNNNTYMVNPESLMKVSLQFRNLIEPFKKYHPNISDLKLEVVGNEFSDRNMENFLKLCQNLPTDVQNSEMEEICKIAKLFGAEQIYNTGVRFIQLYIDPKFYVPDNEYDINNEQTYLFVECTTHKVHHESNLSQLDFDESYKEEKDNYKLNDENKPSKENNDKNKQKISKNVQKDDKIQKSVIYQIRCIKRSMKCNEYKLYMNGNAIYTAKQQLDNIIIGKGNKVHINKDKSNHVANIVQESNHKLNDVSIKNEKSFQIKYTDCIKPNHYSLQVTFWQENKKVTWIPKPPMFDSTKNKFYLNLNGQWNHSSIKSKKNIVLQDGKGHTTFILRKIENNVFEIETFPVFDPLVIFTIGLSDIVGPYVDLVDEINDII